MGCGNQGVSFFSTMKWIILVNIRFRSRLGTLGFELESRLGLELNNRWSISYLSELFSAAFFNSEVKGQGSVAKRSRRGRFGGELRKKKP